MSEYYFIGNKVVERLEQLKDIPGGVVGIGESGVSYPVIASAIFEHFAQFGNLPNGPALLNGSGMVDVSQVVHMDVGSVYVPHRGVDAITTFEQLPRVGDFGDSAVIGPAGGSAPVVAAVESALLGNHMTIATPATINAYASVSAPALNRSEYSQIRSGALTIQAKADVPSVENVKYFFGLIDTSAATANPTTLGSERHIGLHFDSSDPTGNISVSMNNGGDATSVDSGISLGAGLHTFRIEITHSALVSSLDGQIEQTDYPTGTPISLNIDVSVDGVILGSFQDVNPFATSIGTEEAPPVIPDVMDWSVAFLSENLAAAAKTVGFYHLTRKAPAIYDM